MEEEAKNRIRASFERVGFTNAVMFALVMMRNKDLCRRVISASFGREIERIEITTTEKTILAGYATKNVRLDALVEAGGQVFDVEMQANRIGDIPRRARYYHSMIDKELLKPGEEYSDLPDSYVIFIGAKSLLGDGYEPVPARRFEMKDSVTGTPLNDGSVTVILDATAWEKADGELRAMLEFVKKGSQASALDDEGGLATALQDAVDQVREKERNMEIMTAATQLDNMNKELDRNKEVISDLKAQNKEQADVIEAKDATIEAYALEVSELKAMLADALAKSSQD